MATQPALNIFFTRVRVGVCESGCKLCLPFLLSVTHHTSCLYGLGHISSIGLTPEHMTVKTMTANIHDKGKRVHIAADAHKRQETNSALHQHFFFILVTQTLRINKHLFLED